MNITDIGKYLEHQGWSDDQIDEYLAHFGVKGMKWGVRRQKKEQNKGSAKTVSNHDVRNRNLKIAAGVLAVAAVGIVGQRYASDTIRNAKLGDVNARLSSMSDKQKREVGARLAQSINKNVPISAVRPTTVRTTSSKTQIDAFHKYLNALESDLHLATPTASELARAGKTLGI